MALCAQPEVIEATRRLGDAAASDFLNAVSVVSGVTKEKLTHDRIDLPWLLARPGAVVEPPPPPPPPRPQFRRTGQAPAPPPPQPVYDAMAAGGAGMGDGRTNPLLAVAGLRKLSRKYVPGVTQAFCLPPNPALAALKLRASNNLHKMRSHRNIAGYQLPLPGAHTPTPYRYAQLAAEARQLCALAEQVEGATTTSHDEQPAAHYTVLQARQDVRFARAVVRLADMRVSEAWARLRRSELQQERARLAAEHWQRLLDEGVARLEHASLALLESGRLEAVTSCERRARDWEGHKTQAQQDVRIAAEQVRSAREQVRVVAEELRVTRLKADEAQAIADYLGNKFTSFELYEWMSNVLGRAYSFALQQAAATAQLALDQLGFERQRTPPPLVQADYWQSPTEKSARGGGASRLSADLDQLEQFRQETERRKLSLEQTFSVASLAPDAFQRFRDTGVLSFSTPMELFDREYPGHYLRLVRRVRARVAVTQPLAAGIRATLSASRISRAVISGTTFQTVAIQQGPDQLALSAARGGVGLVELEGHAETSTPFEGIGVDASWELRMPKAANLFDYRTLADVLFSVEYSALDSVPYRQQVTRALSRELSASRSFSLRRHFPDAWYDLHNPSQTAMPLAVKLATRADDFPPNLDELRLGHVALALVRNGNGNGNGKGHTETIEIDGVDLRFAPAGASAAAGGTARTLGGAVSTRQGNGAGWSSMLGLPPVGQWSLTLPESAAALLQQNAVEDVMLVVTYSGRTPDWPV
jgi:hypothetical protein